MNTALGVYGINSTQYANGLHTIAWVVSDSAGVTSGVGSRFFSIFNTGSSVTEAAMRPIGPDLGRWDGEVALKASEAPILMRAGFSTLRSMQTVKAGVSGRTVRASARTRSRGDSTGRSLRLQFARGVCRLPRRGRAAA